MAEPISKSETAKREEEVLAYWRENRTFEKSVEKPAPQGDFVFYDGPPFATGLPHMGHLLSSAIKDAIPRYKTMRGYRVRRRWGWDTHGLPIESLVEKKLGLKSKKDIEALGVDAFNEAAKSMVLEYVHDWERYVERIGRWVDFRNSYKTMDNSYIESVWWGLSEAHRRGLMYEGRKVLMYCPHCETPLAKAEIAMDNSYQDVTEEAVTVKFKLKPGQKIGGWEVPDNTFILAWTTTPWTLPGNVALAVGEEIDYVIAEVSAKAVVNDSDSTTRADTDKEDDYFVVFAKDRLQFVQDAQGTKDIEVKKEVKGTELLNLSYEPLYEIEKVQAAGKPNTWTVLPADFVTTQDGTGVVHTAVIYGEDDYQLGVKEDLPMVPLLGASGRFTDDAPEFIRGKYFKHHKNGFPQAAKGEDAEHFIKRDLSERGLLFSKEQFTHSYPHCYRCNTPLIYNAITSWFLKINPEVKERMLRHNESVSWYPEHLKEGRFKNIVENAPDWTISRNRFWASPLPVWRNEKTGAVTVIGTLDELRARTKKSGNRYLIMRHGESLSNVNGVLDAKGDPKNVLTEKGLEQVRAAAQSLAGKGITRIYASPLVRTRITAETVAELIGLPKENIHYDNRLLESGVGEFDGKSIEAYHAFFPQLREKMQKTPEGGENWHDTKTRMTSVLYEIEYKHRNETVLIISHSGPLEMLQAGAQGLCDDEAGAALESSRLSIGNGEVRELPFTPLPHNAHFELDLHRPYIDQLELIDEGGAPLRRIPEVVDCWVESGSMPFAELHYTGPGSAAEAEFSKRFPGDYIAEYIAQTRTWFYYMHALGSLLFDAPAFKNVVSTGTILAADGQKMSKSKGNYTDPLENLDRFGADALRFYLLGSVVMQAEDINFKDDELRDVHNRVVNILWNSYKFYDLYKAEYAGADPAVSTHVLDRWVLARLAELVRDATVHMDAYDTVRAARAIASFIDDFSTWYVRRSRERVKSEGGEDKQFALATMRHALVTLARVAAPLMPFIAESISQGVGGEHESVHLQEWPHANAPDAAALASMQLVREIVSIALKERAAKGIKVRQPLARLTVTLRASPDDPKPALSPELLEIIKDELNVKAVELGADPSAAAPVLAALDTDITPDLKEEGDIRELMRHVQELRKSAGLMPGEAAALIIAAEPPLRISIEKYQAQLMKAATVTAITFGPDDAAGPLMVGDSPVKVALRKA